MLYLGRGWWWGGGWGGFVFRRLFELCCLFEEDEGFVFDEWGGGVGEVFSCLIYLESLLSVWVFSCDLDLVSLGVLFF